MKLNGENSRILIQDPDPLVRGMDPRIRFHPKMSWIRNTGCSSLADELAYIYRRNFLEFIKKLVIHLAMMT